MTKSCYIVLLMLATSGGCVRWEFSLLREHWDGELNGIAKAAMRENASIDPKLCEHHYSEGWTEGYENVLRGGNGEPPLVPPTQYMDPFLRRPAQANRVNVWREGFIAGAAVARERGVAGYANLPGGVPTDPAMLQPPFYCSDVIEQAIPPATRTVLPSPLPPVLKSDQQESSDNSRIDDEKKSETSGQKKPEALLPNSDRDGDASPSPSDQPNAARPEKLPSPADDRASDNLLEDDSVTQSFQRLDRAAALANQSGWSIPIPPVRQERVADANGEAVMRELPVR